jgi:membrane protein
MCPPMTGGSPWRVVKRRVLRGARRAWHDLRLKDLYRNGREFELMHRALGFAALAILTVIPLLILVAAANPTQHRGLAGWVVYGMDLSDSSADAVTQLFSAPARVLGTTSVFSAVLVSVAGVSFAGSVQAGFERIWGLPAGPWHKIWRQAVWAAGLIAYIYATATVGAVTHRGSAETAGRVAVAVVLGVAFFWWGLRFLLGGRVSYLAALPGAVATIVCLAGLRVFSGLVFEPLIASNAVSYGALGTVLIVQSWLIGVGWVVYGGQLFGRWFHDAWLQPRTDRRRGHGKEGGQDPVEVPGELRAGMGLPVGRLEALSRDMRVNLRGGRGGMAKDLLHAAQVGAPLKQVSSRGMPDGVRTRVPQQVMYDAACGPRVEPTAPGTEEECRPAALVRQHGTPGLFPAGQGSHRGQADRHDPLLAALAENPDGAPLPVESPGVKLA